MNSEQINGILIVDKPNGFTSHDIVEFIRRKFQIKKVGHAGTLDPQATGVLVLLLGKFTKISQDLTSHDKEYEARLTLGVATDTQDGQGQITKRQKTIKLKLNQVEKVFTQFLGKIEQVPPMFSAARYKGRRLYALAREGRQVSRLPRQIHIYKLKMTNFALPYVYFSVSCSKGTYIRTLCADIAERLGCVGHLSELRRIRSGPYVMSQAVSLDRLKEFSLQQLRQVLIENSSA